MTYRTGAQGGRPKSLRNSSLAQTGSCREQEYRLRWDRWDGNYHVPAGARSGITAPNSRFTRRPFCGVAISGVNRPEGSIPSYAAPLSSRMRRWRSRPSGPRPGNSDAASQRNVIVAVTGWGLGGLPAANRSRLPTAATDTATVTSRRTLHIAISFFFPKDSVRGKTRESAEPNDRFPHLALVEAIARVLRQDLAYDDPNPTR